MKSAILSNAGFNRYIVECKSGISVERYIRKRVLIDT